MAERARGLLVTFDPNVRTGVEPDMERWRAVFRRMAALCTVLKASEEDLALLHPETDPESLAEQAAGQGPALVVLTRGAGGAVAWHGRFRIDINAPAVTVADTVGAGDAFQAMLIAGLLANGARGAPSVAGLPAAILRRLVGDAVLAGSLACARPGADPPSSAELAAARAAHPGVTSFV
jgi:fructokinase